MDADPQIQRADYKSRVPYLQDKIFFWYYTPDLI